MTTLTIDIGNSSTKFCEWSSLSLDAPSKMGNWWICKEDVFSIDSLEKSDITGVIVSSVSHRGNPLIELLKKEAKCPVVDFNYEEISRFYDLSHYSGRLGPDRMAAALGANLLLPGEPKLVVDIGTAMTIDVVDEKGVFCGGNISLGLRSRLSALARSTSRLPSLQFQNADLNADDIYFGDNTEQAIFRGAYNGILAEIYSSYLRAKERYGVKKIVATGGDLPLLLKDLKNILPIEQDPFLVGRGLDYHLRLNYLETPVGSLSHQTYER